jgi:2'-5' RNA ligase
VASGHVLVYALKQCCNRYNKSFMVGLLYAAVTYVRSPAGVFVEEMRRDLHPAHTHADAHITILPPRNLKGTEEQAIRQLELTCRTVAPFEVTMGDVESFVPATPTVFIRVAHGAYRFRELHDRLNNGALGCEEPWPYMPHLTIVKMDTLDEARKVVSVARPRWDQCDDNRKIRIEKVVFVKGVGERWMDLATFSLGQTSKK